MKSELSKLYNTDFWATVRTVAQSNWEGGVRPSLLSSNAKVIKGEKLAFQTGILHLAPSYAANTKKTVCAFASLGCAATCLNDSGHGSIHMRPAEEHMVHIARVLRTIWYQRDPDSFMKRLRKDIKNLVARAKNNGLTPVIRLNGTSDILWERTGIIQEFPDVQFYDYTKIPNRRNLPDNYDLTFSLSENNKELALNELRNGVRVAVVFRVNARKKNTTLPTTWEGFNVVDGDETDLRFLEPGGVVVGLRAKGGAMKDKTGFVQNV